MGNSQVDVNLPHPAHPERQFERPYGPDRGWRRGRSHRGKVAGRWLDRRSVRYPGVYGGGETTPPARGASIARRAGIPAKPSRRSWPILPPPTVSFCSSTVISDDRVAIIEWRLSAPNAGAYTIHHASRFTPHNPLPPSARRASATQRDYADTGHQQDRQRQASLHAVGWWRRSA